MVYIIEDNGFRLTDISIEDRNGLPGKFRIKVYSGDTLIEDLIPIVRLGKGYHVTLDGELVAEGQLRYLPADQELIVGQHSGTNLTPAVGRILRSLTGSIDLVFENI